MEGLGECNINIIRRSLLEKTLYVLIVARPLRRYRRYCTPIAAKKSPIVVWWISNLDRQRNVEGPIKDASMTSFVCKIVRRKKDPDFFCLCVLSASRRLL